MATSRTGRPRENDTAPAVGGAMDLAAGAKRVWVVMEHTTQGRPPAPGRALLLPADGARRGEPRLHQSRRARRHAGRLPRRRDRARARPRGIAGAHRGAAARALGCRKRPSSSPPNAARASSPAPPRSLPRTATKAPACRSIARAAGVSKGTLYNYFDSKAALFAAYVERGMQPHPRPHLRRSRDGRGPRGHAAGDRAAHDADDALPDRAHHLPRRALGGGEVPRAGARLLRGRSRPRDPAPRRLARDADRAWAPPGGGPGLRRRAVLRTDPDAPLAPLPAAASTTAPTMPSSSASSMPRSRCSSPATAFRPCARRRTAETRPGCR